MDKEQIIIDGVDVNKCKYLNTFSDCDGYHYYCALADYIVNEYCEYYKDCYFKQLVRKTQECEELRIAYKKAQDILGRIDRANELKSYSLQKSIKECDRYCKALEEIKEIIATSLSDDHDPAEGLYGEIDNA